MSKQRRVLCNTVVAAYWEDTTVLHFSICKTTYQVNVQHTINKVYENERGQLWSDPAIRLPAAYPSENKSMSFPWWLYCL